MSKKVSIFNIYGTDKKAEEEGKWLEFGSEIRVKIRRFNSKPSLAVRTKLYKPYEARAGMLKAPVIPEDVQTMLVNTHLAEGVIVDWAGIYDAEGNEIPFSTEAALQVLSALPDFSLEIARASIDMDSFRSETVENTTKN